MFSDCLFWQTQKFLLEKCSSSLHFNTSVASCLHVDDTVIDQGRGFRRTELSFTASAFLFIWLTLRSVFIKQNESFSFPECFHTSALKPGSTVCRSTDADTAMTRPPLSPSCWIHTGEWSARDNEHVRTGRWRPEFPLPSELRAQKSYYFKPPSVCDNIKTLLSPQSRQLTAPPHSLNAG